MAESPLPLARAELNLLTNQWRYLGGGDYRVLFRPLVLDKSTQERVAQIPHWFAEAKRMLSGAVHRFGFSPKRLHTPNGSPTLVFIRPESKIRYRFVVARQGGQREVQSVEPTRHHTPRPLQ